MEVVSPDTTGFPSRWMVYSRTLRYYAPHGPAIAAGLLLALLAVGVNLLKPWPLKYIVDDVLGGVGGTRAAPASPAYHNTELLFLLCAAVVAIQFFWGVLNLAANYVQVKVGLSTLMRVRCELFSHLQRLSLRFHDAQSSADSMYRVSYDAQAIQSIFNRGFSTIFIAVVTLVAMVLVMVRLDSQLTGLALVIAPVLLCAIYLFAERIRTESTRIAESESALSGRAQEGLTGIRLVRAFGREDYELNRFEEQCVRSLQANLRLTFTQVSSALMIGTVMGAGTAAMIYLGAKHVMEGALSVGEMLIFISYLVMLYEPLQTLSYTSWALEGAAAGAERVFEILDKAEEVQDRPNALALHAARGLVEFEKVSFGYDPARPVLKDVSFRVNPGEVVAFVGATGVGKTTLLSLIPRFYDPGSGVVKLDGRDLREVRKGSVRAQIGMVLQDTMLLAGTIRDNIGYGRLGAGHAEIAEAAQRARVDEFIAGLAKGFDTEVGERGARLSVGQRQRVGLARAFLKDAPVLLLDEPTSALDPETEVEVMKALRDLMKGRTVIIVTHRIATVHESDRIFVLEGGRLVEEGRGPELLRRNAVYAGLYRAQVKGGK